jgi:simple sugar transport system substrate-binding protein
MGKTGSFVLSATACLALIIGTAPASAKLNDNKIDITVIVHCCLGNVFWEPLIKGAKEAGEKFGVNVDIQNAEGDPAKQVNLIEQAIANKQNGIVAMIAQADAMAEPLKKARAMGIHVIAANVDHPDGAASGTREAYVGQDFVQAGRLIAERVIKDYGLKGPGKCLLPAEAPEQHHLAARGQGVLQALKKVGLEGEILKSGDNVEEGLTIISQYLLANPDTKCVIGLGNTPTSVIPQAAKEAGIDKMPNGGFDVSPRIMENIKAGLTTATVDQQQFWQGFMPVLFLAYEIRYGLAPADFNTSGGLIDKSNAELAAKNAGTYR